MTRVSEVTYFDMRYDSCRMLILDVPTAADAPKKKRNLRGSRPEGKKIDLWLPSYPMPDFPSPDDRPEAGLARTVTNLLSKHGALQDQFYRTFHVCGICKRVIAREVFDLKAHSCVIEVEE